MKDSSITNYFICGFMAAGKSTLLKTLKSESSYKGSFFDLDYEVFVRYGQDFLDLGKMIESIGIHKFRELEFQVLQLLCKNYPSHMIALGGGALENDALYVFVQDVDHGTLIFLDTPIETCLERLGNKDEIDKRPVAKKNLKFLRELHFKRLERYLAAKITLSGEESIRQWIEQS